MTRDFTAEQAQIAIDRCLPDGFIAEGEIPADHPNGSPNPQAQDWHELADRLDGYDIDRAVGTSFGPFQKWRYNGSLERMELLPAPEYAKPLIEKGWTCIPYVYPAESFGDSVAGKLAYCRHFTHEACPEILAPGQGWYNPEPVCGTYSGPFGNYELNDPAFAGKESCAGFSVWDAGEQF